MNNDIQQQAGFGSHDNTFVGVQEIHYGLSPADAMDMAMELFRQHFPVLRQDALDEVRTIAEKELGKTDPQNIEKPTARIVVPLLQNASLAEEPDLRKMYGTLLARDMNKETKSVVHPAFVDIINQMSGNDARLLKMIYDINNSIPVGRIRFEFDTKYLTSVFPHFYSPLFNSIDPWVSSMSIENLSRLNLFDMFEGNVISYDYEQMKKEQFVIDRFEFAKKNNPGRDLKISLFQYVIQQNDFGKSFTKSCF